MRESHYIAKCKRNTVLAIKFVIRTFCLTHYIAKLGFIDLALLLSILFTIFLNQINFDFVLKFIHLLGEITNNIISPNINDGARPRERKSTNALEPISERERSEDKTLYSGTKSKAGSLRHKACLKWK